MSSVKNTLFSLGVGEFESTPYIALSYSVRPVVAADAGVRPYSPRPRGMSLDGADVLPYAFSAALLLRRGCGRVC